MKNSPGSICNLGTLNFSTINSGNFKEENSKADWQAETSDNDMCQMDSIISGEPRLRSVSMLHDFNKSFNPMEEPCGDEQEEAPLELESEVMVQSPSDSCTSFQISRSLSEDDDELTESKIRSFLDDKALELKRLQTPLYEEFYNSVIPSCSISMDNNTETSTTNGASPNYLKLPPKTRSPLKPADVAPCSSSPGPASGSRRTSNVSGEECPIDLSSPQSQCNDTESQQPTTSPTVNFVEVKKKWKEELDQELERKREMMRQVGGGGKTSSPIDRGSNRQRDKSRFASPGN